MKYRKFKIKVAFFFITLFFAAIFCYLTYLKTAKGEEYERRALRQYTNRYDVEIYPQRGAILDRNMKELATSVSVFNVILDPVVLNENSRNAEVRQKNIDKTLKVLNEKTDATMEELLEYMETDSEGQLTYPSSYIKIKKGISRIEADELKAEIKEEGLKGIWLEEDSKRVYPYGRLAANVVGFTRGDSSWGIENYYNDSLTGIAGRAFITYTDSATPVINTIPAKNGHTVITTIDLSLQEYAEEALKNAVEQYEPQNAALIVLNPKTGEILAMAMYPSFDPNDEMEPIYLEYPEFSQQWEQKSQEEKINELNRMWKNYSITSAFEPGSIFKPILIAAAIDEGAISPNDTFGCGGYKRIYNIDISCHYKPGHGIQTVEEVIANSCNVACMDIVAKMGPELFYEHFKDFGFGERTEIDLPGEESARYLVYGREDFKNPVNLATSSFGQGSACTSIQALNAFAAVINGGNVMKPFVVSKVLDEDGNVVIDNKPTTVRKIISDETSDTLRYMMKSVVDYGTGKKAKINGYSIGGKTGTAEQGVRNKKDHTLTFIGYLPVEDPELVALALLDKPKNSEAQGSATAAPMLKAFLEKAILHLGIKPSNPDEVSDDLFVSNDSVTVPDFQEKSMGEATEMIVISGLKYISSGDGNTITAQWPKPGTKVERGTTITLYTIGTEGEIQTIPVPNVVGLSSDAALKELIENSFTAIVDMENTDGMIVSEQYPQAGRHVLPNTDVELKFVPFTENGGE